MNVNKETTHEEPKWTTKTSPAILHKNSCCQAIFTANFVVPGCETDSKVNFFLAGIRCRRTVKEQKTLQDLQALTVNPLNLF